jgi:hypothetical protein
VRDAARQELVRQARRALALLLLGTVLAAGCGGDEATDAGGPAVAWKGTPVMRTSPSGARVLIGELENKSSGKLRIAVPQVRVVDGRGRRIRSTAVFSSSFTRSLYPHNAVARARPAEYPEPEQERVGYLAALDEGEAAPLTVSWREPRTRRAKRILLGPASLPVPAAAVEPAG